MIPPNVAYDLRSTRYEIRLFGLGEQIIIA